MLKINKNAQDVSNFNSWAKAKKLHVWTEFSSPESTFHDAYIKVRNHIGNVEQGGLSAYTEKPLGSNIHIDHFRKRSIFPHLTFDYSNLLVDDHNDNYGACYKDNHAGVNVTTFTGPNRILCPVTENIADFIDFMIDGKMIPKRGLSELDELRVKETIRVFNLNHATLKNTREMIIRNVSLYRENGLSADEIRTCMDPQGYPSVILWALNNP